MKPIKSKIASEKIAVIGSGVVGQATGKGFISKGYEVTFIDTNERIISTLRKQGYQAFTPQEYDEKQLTCDISFVSVPTPTEDNVINLEYLKKACIDLGIRLKRMSGYHLVVTRSTLLPGTNKNIVIKTLEAYSQKKEGINFGLCFNPEYLREKSAETDFAKPWIVIIGENSKKSGDLLEGVYKNFGSKIYRITIEEAEIQKYIHNLYNAVKISFFNEFREICSDMNLDSSVVFDLVTKSCEGIWNPKYGTLDFGPFDGVCLPKDTQAFYSWAKQNGYLMKVLGSAIESNKDFAEYIRLKS